MNKKYVFIGLLLVASCVVLASLKSADVYSTNNDVDFDGTWNWEKNSDRSTFDLTLDIDNNEIQGGHCAIAQEGRRIDCVDEGEFSIQGTLNNNIANVTYKSYYSFTEGTAELKILSDGRLEWKVITKASGQTYLPTIAILSKE